LIRVLKVLALVFFTLPCLAQENTALLCADGIDNDGNGLIDCMDTGCIVFAAPLAINGCDNCGDGLSFGDEVIAYESGCPGNIDPNPEGALGLNDHDGSSGDSPEIVFLGDGGFIEIAFTNNLLVNSGNNDPDIWVFEAGPPFEGTSIALRPNDAFTENVVANSGIAFSIGDYYNIGGIGGLAASLDLDLSFPGFAFGELKFNAVRLTDASGGSAICSLDGPGADIDAVCAVSSIAPEDCNGVPNGTATLDDCLVCDSDPTNDNECEDCNGVPNGNATLDACMVCDSDPSNDNETCEDCAGVLGGSSTLDDCGVCDDDSSNDNACLDCEGIPDGPAYEDECGVCDADPTNDNLCADCAGVVGGTATTDVCGVCDDDPSNDDQSCGACFRDVLIPTAFSPNSDGVNDILRILGTEENDLTLSFTVYDRWGKLVFERVNFKQSNTLNLWNGTIRAEDAPTGVYVFECICESETEEPVQFGGNITLIR